MSPGDFNHLLTAIKGLSPAQLQRLRRQLERAERARPPSAGTQAKATKRPSRASGTRPGQGRAKPARASGSAAELHRRLLDAGLISGLPDSSRDVADGGPADEPIRVNGEPLSETIVRERR